jgi:hypothetical protein
LFAIKTRHRLDMEQHYPGHTASERRQGTFGGFPWVIMEPPKIIHNWRREIYEKSLNGNGSLVD